MHTWVGKTIARWKELPETFPSCSWKIKPYKWWICIMSFLSVVDPTKMCMWKTGHIVISENVSSPRWGWLSQKKNICFVIIKKKKKKGLVMFFIMIWERVFCLGKLNRSTQNISLEKTSKIIQPNPQRSLNCVPKHQVDMPLKLPQGWQLHHHPEKPILMFENPFSEEAFPTL